MIDGQGVNQSAFDGTAANVTIEFLTVKDFAPPNGQNVVNHDNGASWTVEFNTIEDNTSPGSVKGPDYPGGAALGMGSGDVYEYNCLTKNGEYALNAAGTRDAVRVQRSLLERASRLPGHRWLWLFWRHQVLGHD